MLSRKNIFGTSAKSPGKVLREIIKISEQLTDRVPDPRIKVKDEHKARVKAKKKGLPVQIPPRRGRKPSYGISDFMSALLYKWYYNLDFRRTATELRGLKFNCPDYTYLYKVKDKIPTKTFIKACQLIERKLK